MKNKLQSLVIALIAFMTAMSAIAQDRITTLGQITSVYQSQGDMMTLSSGGYPLRVAIGSTGQVLTVSGGIPVWSSSPAVSGLSSAGSIVLGVQGDANRIFTFDGSSDTALTLKFGDGTVSAQTFSIVSATADAADSGTLCLAGGGDCLNTRGSYILATGNEQGSVGDITIASGAATNSLVSINAGDNGSTVNINVGAGLTNRVAVTTTSATFANDLVMTAGNINMSAAKDINFSVGLGTVALQEAVAGTACSGSVTANATTPVVTSTTCATTGSRIFLTKTSTSTVNGSCYISALSNGVSFSITCLATDTGTYNWIIFHEAP